MKKKNKQEIPPLCAAVKRVREAYGDTQERFARRVGIAVMTVSHFETGRTEPRDPRVLLNLAKVTAEKLRMVGGTEVNELVDWVAGETPRDMPLKLTLRGDEELFRDAYADYERIRQTDRRVGEIEPATRPTFRSMREWRLSLAARLAALYYPECVRDIESAARPAIDIINEVLASADENQIDYERFEREAFALADRQALLSLKKERNQ
jgi:transcriptional regulator with XRE-family HTH domain